MIKVFKLLPFVLIAMSAQIFSLPVSGKEVELNCKTEKGRNVIYLINSNPQSVKDTKDGSDYEVLLFSPTKLVFKKEIDINLAKYFSSTFTYTIDRTNLNYQVNQKNYTNADNLPKTAEGGDNYTGKCSVIPRKPVAF
jgi:hypothetical protein